MNPKTADIVFSLPTNPGPEEPVQITTLKARDDPGTGLDEGWDEDPLDMAPPGPEQPTGQFRFSWEHLKDWA